MLRKDTGRTLGAFLFEDILCRWGMIEEIVIDNGTPFLAVLDWLTQKYHISHICISAYSGSKNCPHVLTFFTIYDIVWERTNASRTCLYYIVVWPQGFHLSPTPWESEPVSVLLRVLSLSG
jgi:hypothetical protein